MASVPVAVTVATVVAEGGIITEMPAASDIVEVLGAGKILMLGLASGPEGRGNETGREVLPGVGVVR